MSKKLTTSEFIEKAISIHGEKYEYTLVKYRTAHDKVKIQCSKHGIFEQKPYSHTRGIGCNDCAKEHRHEILTKTQDNFIKEANIIHNYFYDYSHFDYEKSGVKGKIICPIHGEFWQLPINHLRGSSCPDCANIKRGLTNKYYEEDFIELANRKHDCFYNYSEVQYTTSAKEVCILCPIHGYFYQRPYAHLQGKGCSKCVHKVSKPEIEVQDFVKSLGYEIETNNRKILKGKELDIFIPSLNKAIEFNGVYWHYSEKYFVPGKHATKSNLCKEKNIKLFHLREDLWLNKKEKMKKVIKQFIIN